MLQIDGGPNAKYKVIVVDDDRSVADSLGGILEGRYQVSVTGNPANVLKWVGQRPVDVIVSDWQMPSMNGITLFRQVRRLSPPIGFLLMTGHVEEFRQEVSHEERRLLGLIAKPFAAEQLFERIDQLARLATMKRSVRLMRPVVPVRPDPQRR